MKTTCGNDGSVVTNTQVIIIFSYLIKIICFFLVDLIKNNYLCSANDK
nr:MAG TPA: hypothetical protein [Caudoviricetes sp.]